MKKHILFSIAVSALFLISFASSSNDLLPTNLRITVLDELGNIVEGAKVVLYANEDDYRNEENPIQDAQFTDSKGRVNFKGLEPKVYFVLVEKDDKNNVGGAVETDPLEEGKSNRVNIIIE